MNRARPPKRVSSRAAPGVQGNLSGALVGLVVLSTVVAPWRPLSHALGTRFLPVLLDLGLGAGCFFALLRRPTTGARDRRAQAALLVGGAFAVWLIVTASASDRPVLSFVGNYAFGTGALFSIGLVGVWAIGRAGGTRSGRRVEDAIVWTGVLNAAVGLVQAVGLQPLGLLSLGNRATGFLLNPVYFAAFEVGVFWVVAVRVATRTFADWRAEWPWGIAAVAVAGAVDASGGRSAFALLGVASGAAVVAFGWRRGALVVACAALGVALLAGLAVLPRAAEGGVTGTSRVGSDTGISSRLDTWRGGLRAVAHDPVLGAGPGRYRSATEAYRTLGQARSDGSEGLYSDAHNLAVEYLVTTGVPGALLFFGFVALVVALAGWSSPLAGFGLLVLAAHALEPQTTFVTPLAFLALGVAGARDESVRLRLRSYLVAPLLGFACWLAVAVGSWDITHPATTIDATLNGLRTSRALLRPWKEAYLLSGEVESKLAPLGPQHGPAAAVTYYREATGHEPDDPITWLDLASAERAAGDSQAAEAAARRALVDNPWSAQAFNTLGALAADRGDTASAREFYQQSLRIAPTENPARRALDRLSPT